MKKDSLIVEEGEEIASTVKDDMNRMNIKYSYSFLIFLCWVLPDK